MELDLVSIRDLFISSTTHSSRKAQFRVTFTL